MLDEDSIAFSRSSCVITCDCSSKRDGTVHFRVDYCKLNLVTTRDIYRLTTISDSLAALKRGKVFSTLNINAVYHQTPMGPESKNKTAFITGDGLN